LHAEGIGGERIRVTCNMSGTGFTHASYNCTVRDSSGRFKACNDVKIPFVILHESVDSKAAMLKAADAALSFTGSAWEHEDRHGCKDAFTCESWG
jgi:hypothetical protein